MAYLGYEPRRLGTLLGALEEVGLEVVGRAGAGPAPIDGPADAVAAHKTAVRAVTVFGPTIAAIVGHDPLGRYRHAALDPNDLGQWTLHRGGSWRAVTDPTPLPTTGSVDPAVNARRLAADLTIERWQRILRDPAATAALRRYLDGLRHDPAARGAFLEALGPERFGALIDAGGRRFAATHQHAGPELTGARTAYDLAAGLGLLWAGARASGQAKGEPWSQAVLGAHLDGARAVFGAAARTAGAASPAEEGAWGAILWRRLVEGFGTRAVADAVLAGDDILRAVASDGRAARGFLLALIEDGDRHLLPVLLTNAASSPAVSGAVLLASTDPSSTGDDDEVRRTVQPVLREVARLAAEAAATFPLFDAAGRVTSLAGPRILPTDLGTYAGRYAHRLIDPCDATPVRACPVDSAAWPGWREREAAELLRWLAGDGRAGADLRDAAGANFQRRVRALDLTGDTASPDVRREAFVLGAVGAVVRGRQLADVVDAQDRYQRMAGGLDLVVGAAAFVAPAATGAATAWGTTTDIAGATGWPAPAALLTQPFHPGSVREALARSRGDEQLMAATMRAVVGAEAQRQLGAAGALGTAPPVSPPPAPADTTAPVVPGANANAAAYALVEPMERWLGSAPAPAAGTVGLLMAVAGDGAAQGAGWSA